MGKNLEYWIVVAIARGLGSMPRGMARFFSGCIAFVVYCCFGRLRRVGQRKLRIGFYGLPKELQPLVDEQPVFALHKPQFIHASRFGG